MIEQYMRDDDESDCESDLEESDLEHIVRKVFNNVKDEDVSRVNFVVNALKDVKLQKAIQCLKLQNGIDKLKLFLLKSTNGELSRPILVCIKIAIAIAQFKRVGALEFFRSHYQCYVLLKKYDIKSTFLFSHCFINVAHSLNCASE